MLKTFVSGIKMYLDKAVNQLRNEVGWKSESTEQVFSETVTTVAGNVGNEATLSYTELLTDDALKVTFDGTEYTCTKDVLDGDTSYGAIFDMSTGQTDFTDFPFEIYSYVDENSGDIVNIIETETAGEHSVVVETATITYTDAFKNGVSKNATMIVNFTSEDEGEFIADKSNADIISAFQNGIRIIGYVSEAGYEGLLFNLERIYTLNQMTLISFNALFGNTDNPRLYWLSQSDETGNVYKLYQMGLRITEGIN